MLVCVTLNTTRRTTMMKMVSAATIFLLLLFCPVVAPADSKSQCDRYVAIGGNFVVPLNSKEKDQAILRWRFNDIAIFSRNNGKIDKGKGDDIDERGSLKLKNVTVNQSGIYKPEVFNSGRIADTTLKEMRLCAIASVSKPTVNIECEESEQVTFTCTLDPKDSPLQKNLDVVWHQDSKSYKKNEWSFKLDRTSVTQEKFTCNVSNKASYAVSEAKVQTCYTSFMLPEDLFGINIWFFIGGGGGIVLLLIILVIICCIRARKMKRMRLKDEGEFRLQWSNNGDHQRQQPAGHRHHHYHQPAGHHHHHHHRHEHSHHQQQPAGHTGPRPSRSRQRGDLPQPPQSKPPGSGQPLPTPRGAPSKGRRPATDEDTEQPPPLPQPRKKAPRTQRV